MCRLKRDNGVGHECASQPPQSQVSSGLDDEGLGYVDATGLLSVAVQRLDHAISVIHVAGEVDMVTGPSLENQLRKMLATQPERLIVDLSRVSFMGSTALAVLLNIRHMADQQSTRFQLRGTDRRPVAAPLRVTGLDHLFDIVRSGE